MRIILWILAVLSVVALALWLNAGTIAERGLGYALGRQGIPVQSYRIVRLGKSHVILRDVVLGENGEVKTQQLDLRIRWNGSKAEQFDVALQGADIAARLVDGNVTLGGVERAWTKTPAPAAGDSIDLHIAGDLTAQYIMGGAAKAAATAATVTATRDATALLLPLTLDATAEGDLTKTIAYRGTLVNGKKLSARFEGSYDMAERSGKTSWDIAPVRFAPDGFTFSELTPFYAAEMPTFPMRLSAKGVLLLEKGGWKLTPDLTFHELPLETLLASALGEDATVEGTIGGDIPLTISPKGWQIKPAALKNKGGLKIAVSPVGAAASMLQNHPQSQIVLSALGNFHVDEMSLRARSTDDHGGVNMTWHFLGANPELYGGKKVDFTLAVNANLEDIWLSATQAETLAGKAQEAATRKGAKP